MVNGYVHNTAIQHFMLRVTLSILFIYTPCIVNFIPYNLVFSTYALHSATIKFITAKRKLSRAFSEKKIAQQCMYVQCTLFRNFAFRVVRELKQQQKLYV